MRFWLVILFFIGLTTGCAKNDSAQEGSISLKKLLKICHWDAESDYPCEKLHDRKVKFVGKLYYPEEEKLFATVFLGKLEVPTNEDDILWDKISEEEYEKRVTLSVPEGSDLRFELKRLHQKTVHIEGLVNTECLTVQREADEKMNRLNNNSDPNDDVIIMVRGLCHSFGEYIYEYKIAKHG